jgi:uncharacterized caspase-like protein
VAPGHAEKRVALVIGNAAYGNVPALPNPINDATDIAASFERLGFTVRRVVNGSFDDMRRALRDFAPLARQADMAAVYFAGHGMEIGGENWLIPVDAELKVDVAADQEAIALKSVQTIVGTASQLGLVILDACRNNPFLPRMQRSIPTRAVERGLTRVEPSGSVLVAYAAKEGTTANDGTSRNSPFTAALLHNLETPGLEINFVFRRVRDEVLRATNRTQEPVTYGALSSTEIILKPGLQAALPQPALPSDLEQSALKRQALVSSLFSAGLKVADRDFVFGSRYEVVNAQLDTPFRIPTYDSLPKAAEYSPDDIRYFWVRLNALQAVQSEVKKLAREPKCVDDVSYITFLFKNGSFFRISLRMHRTPQCRDYEWIREAIFAPGQNKLSLSGHKGQVSLYYHDDDKYCFLEIFQDGIARNDDRVFNIRLP